MTKKMHARFWRYDGNHSAGQDCERYDPHGFGVPVIAAMVWLVDNGEPTLCGVSLEGVVVNHHKGDDFGHQVHVAATAQQWDAAKQWLEQQAA